ncbi:MAG: NAD-dependent epimerase/dehydratase family protein [Gemmatimonadota bacterium]|nr:NAD-dependent epimerase/dehydratase family protein [Gemmatimonadota bacterium]MDH3421828.1 NAD-dependent epimerase/dehydratase family protein [Gemmatimonadota bacterium]
MRVFLTGGTGLLGSHLAHELRSHGHGVVALHRRDADTLFLEETECDLVEGDIRDDAEDLSPLMEGCSHVVHGAALVYAGGAWPRVRAVNVDGTRNVLTAARLAGVQHAVHLSSVAVYGDAAPPVDETTPIDSDLPPGDLYARSKREAEEVARGIEEKRGFPVTILRPSAVYGERDRLMAPALKRLLRLPLIPLLGPANNALPVVYAGNVAGAIRLAAEAGRGGTTYDVGFDHPLNQRDLMQWLASGLGLVPRFFTLPAPLVRAGGAVLAQLGVGTPGAKHLPINRLTQLALGDNPFRSSLIRAELGWDPPHQHEAALERTAKSLPR